MKKGFVPIFFLFLISLISSCDKAPTEINPDDTRLIIENVITRFSTAINNRDTSMVSKIATDSIEIYYPQERLPTQGIKSLQEFVANPQWNFVSIKTRKIEVSDDLAYSSSSINIDVLKKNSPDIIKYKGEILMIFQKEEEFWKLSAVTYNIMVVKP